MPCQPGGVRLHDLVVQHDQHRMSLAAFIGAPRRSSFWRALGWGKVVCRAKPGPPLSNTESDYDRGDALDCCPFLIPRICATTSLKKALLFKRFGQLLLNFFGC